LYSYRLTEEQNGFLSVRLVLT